MRFTSTAPYEVVRGIARMGALLLGRRTYDVLAGYRPHHATGVDGEIGTRLDAIPNYVVSQQRLTARGAPGVGRAAEVRALLRSLRPTRRERRC